MELFLLFKREIKEPLKPLLVFLFISGLSSTLLISVINNAAEFVSNSEVNNRSAFLFLFGVSAFLFSKKYVMDRASFLVESTVCSLRNRITDKIRHTELDTLEKVGSSSLYARLTTETTYISNIANNAINATQSAIMILFTLLYIATVSLWSFFLIIIALGVGYLSYTKQAVSFMKMWEEVSIRETAFFETLGHILNGFKEIKMNRSKNESVYQNYKKVN
ncbi:MAG: ABC transporter transmembrane domain-containing protein, partial [Saprospiraceae bacterium]